jgi:hypothetical protein
MRAYDTIVHRASADVAQSTGDRDARDVLRILGDLKGIAGVVCRQIGNQYERFSAEAAFSVSHSVATEVAGPFECGATALALWALAAGPIGSSVWLSLAIREVSLFPQIRNVPVAIAKLESLLAHIPIHRPAPVAPI